MLPLAVGHTWTSCPNCDGSGDGTVCTTHSATPGHIRLMDGRFRAPGVAQVRGVSCDVGARDKKRVGPKKHSVQKKKPKIVQEG